MRLLHIVPHCIAKWEWPLLVLHRIVGGGWQWEVMVAVDEKGNAVLLQLVTFDAQGLSAMVVEATMLVVGLLLVIDSLEQWELQLEIILLCLNNMAVVQSMTNTL